MDNKQQHLTTALELTEHLELIKARQLAAVAGARQAGASWAEIGGAVGMTKQAAQQRFGKLVPAALAVLGDPAAEQLPAAAPAVEQLPAADEFGTVALQLPVEPEPEPVHRIVHIGLVTGAEQTARAERGTGKGPRECPACGRSNHKAAGYWNAAELTPACSATRYDPPRIAGGFEQLAAAARA